MLDAPLDQNRHRLCTLVADYFANQGALEGFFFFRHFFAPLLGGFFSALLLDQNGLGAGNVTTRDAQRGSIVKLLRGLLHAQAEMGLLQRFDLGLQADDIFLA
jgi:hypothetical protein